MSFGMICNQEQIDQALAASLGKKAWAATERAELLTNGGLTANAQASGPDPNAVLGLQSSLTYNYGDGRSQAPGHSFDRPQRRLRRNARANDDDDDESCNRGESVHSFDLSEPQPDSGPYPNRQYGAVPTLRKVTEQSTRKMVTEWEPVEGEHAAQLTGRQVTDDGRVIGPLKTTGTEGYAGTGQEDDHSPGKLFSFDIKATKKASPPDPVVVSNQLRRYEGERMVQVDSGGPLPLPGTMREIVENRWRECPQLRRP
jgi:hypothetical protein